MAVSLGKQRMDVYLAWFCGHWHTDKRVDKMHFLFKSIENDDLIQRIKEKQEDEKSNQNS